MDVSLKYEKIMSYSNATDALGHLIHLRENGYLPRDARSYSIPSNGVLRRWLEQGAVIINGVRPKPKDKISFPIIQLVFFPSGDTVTML